jgi:hypothetical protein
MTKAEIVPNSGAAFDGTAAAAAKKREANASRARFVSVNLLNETVDLRFFC